MSDALALATGGIVSAQPGSNPRIIKTMTGMVRTIDKKGNRMSASRTISLYRGDDQTVEVTLTDSQGQIIDLTGVSLKFSVKQAASDSGYVIQKSSASGSEISLTDPANGIFQLYLVPGDSNSLSPGTYQYDIELTTSGSKVYTVLRSEFKILDDITRP